MELSRDEFFHEIAKSFFEDLTTSFEGLKGMISAVSPVFGDLEIQIDTMEDGDKRIKFIDRDEAQLVMTPEGVDLEDVDTDMSTTVATLYLDDDDKISIVEHGFHIFTPANKNQVLFYTSLIGKKVLFEEAE